MKNEKLVRFAMSAFAFIVVISTTGCVEYYTKSGLRLADYPECLDVDHPAYYGYEGGPPEEMVYGSSGWYYPSYSAVYVNGSWCWAYGHNHGGRVYFQSRFIGNGNHHQVYFSGHGGGGHGGGNWGGGGNAYYSGGNHGGGNGGGWNSGGGGGQPFNNPYRGSNSGGGSGGGHGHR